MPSEFELTIKTIDGRLLPVGPYDVSVWMKLNARDVLNEIIERHGFYYVGRSSLILRKKILNPYISLIFQNVGSGDVLELHHNFSHKPHKLDSSFRTKIKPTVTANDDYTIVTLDYSPFTVVNPKFRGKTVDKTVCHSVISNIAEYEGDDAGTPAVITLNNCYFHSNGMKIDVVFSKPLQLSKSNHYNHVKHRLEFTDKVERDEILCADRCLITPDHFSFIEETTLIKMNFIYAFEGKGKCISNDMWISKVDCLDAIINLISMIYFMHYKKKMDMDKHKCDILSFDENMDVISHMINFKGSKERRCFDFINRFGRELTIWID